MASKFLLLIAVLTAAYAAGSWLGSIHGKQRVESEQLETRRSLEAYLDNKLKDIELGQPFPPLSLVPVGSDEARGLRELMPDGGVLFYFASECPTCLDAVGALNAALTSLPDHPAAGVLATGSNPEYLEQGMHDRGVPLPLYCDTQDILRTKHDMILARSFFALDSAGILINMGTLETDPEEYLTVLTK